MYFIYNFVDKILGLLQLIILVRVLLTWFPNINWWEQPFKLLNDISEPILAPFRRLIPPLGGIDISPIFAMIALGFIQKAFLIFVGQFM